MSMSKPTRLESAFTKNGNIHDWNSNIVEIGAENGKCLTHNVFHGNLVTEEVNGCIVTIAIDDQAGIVGLWHLYHGEGEKQIKASLLPALKAAFMQEHTKIYLIGGWRKYDNGLAGNLERLLPESGFAITDKSLFAGEDYLDIAVTRAGAIHVVTTRAPYESRLHKAETETMLQRCPTGTPAVQKCVLPSERRQDEAATALKL